MYEQETKIKADIDLKKHSIINACSNAVKGIIVFMAKLNARML